MLLSKKLNAGCKSFFFKSAVVSKLLVTMIFVLILTGGCKNSVGTMLDDYNNQFIPIERPDAIPVPGDKDFVAADMLHEKYVVSQDATLTLSGPEGAQTYIWKIYSMEDSSEITNFKSKWGATSKNLVMYMPQSQLSAGTVYKLTLTVTDRLGFKYSATSKLIIYAE